MIWVSTRKTIPVISSSRGHCRRRACLFYYGHTSLHRWCSFGWCIQVISLFQVSEVLLELHFPSDEIPALIQGPGTTHKIVAMKHLHHLWSNFCQNSIKLFLHLLLGQVLHLACHVQPSGKPDVERFPGPVTGHNSAPLHLQFKPGEDATTVISIHFC